MLADSVMLAGQLHTIGMAQGRAPMGLCQIAQCFSVCSAKSSHNFSPSQSYLRRGIRLLIKKPAT